MVDETTMNNINDDQKNSLINKITEVIKDDKGLTNENLVKDVSYHIEKEINKACEANSNETIKKITEKVCKDLTSGKNKII